LGYAPIKTLADKNKAKDLLFRIGKGLPLKTKKGEPEPSQNCHGF
jgi:hypothetical protein